MENTYYTVPTKEDEFETQCTTDLLMGKIKISDVPYQYRDLHAYMVAHIFARTIADAQERHHAYWEIASQLEADVIQSEKEKNKEKADSLTHTYDILFHYTARVFV